MKPTLLIKVKRANLIEKQHFGFVVVVDKYEKILSHIGESDDYPFFLRSCAKPFQALPIITSGAYKKFNFSLEELAVCCASHTASFEHLKFINSIFNKIGLKEENLQCGSHEPFDVESRNYLIKENKSATQTYNNCSGKHVGMLAVCVNNNWDITDYLDFEHPLQKEILDITKKYCNITGDIIDKSLDNCSAPIYGLSLAKAGAGYLRLFLSPEAKLMREAFIKNPVLIGGKEKIDSILMKAGQGKFIAKVGADGLCIVLNIEQEKALVVKLLDADLNARSIVIVESMKQLGWISDDISDNDLLNASNTEIKTLKNMVVGKKYFLGKL